MGKDSKLVPGAEGDETLPVGTGDEGTFVPDGGGGYMEGQGEPVGGTTSTDTEPGTSG